jgi:hypothetical protein
MASPISRRACGRLPAERRDFRTLDRELTWDPFAANPRCQRPLQSPAAFVRTWQARCSSPFVTNTHGKQTTRMTTNSEFYDEQKWCEQCKGYVRFLMSVNFSYCVHCGGRVRLFSRNDGQQFEDHVQRHKWQAS